LNESFTGTKTGQGINTPIALKRNGTYTEIQTQKADGTRTGGFRSIQETDSTVNQTIMYVADGSSYKGDISLHYDSANGEVWATLPAISMPYIRKQNSDLEGGEIHFESADNEVNAGKSIWIDRYNGKIRIVGQNSSGTTKNPFQADIQNDCVNITNAYINTNCILQKNNGESRYVAKDTGYAQGDTVSANRYSGIRMFDKNNVEMATVYSTYQTDGNVTTRLFVKTPTAGATTNQTMGIGAKPDGTFWTFAPTPAAGATGTEITTASWVRTRMSRAVGKTGPTTITTLFSAGLGTGDIPLSQPFTNFDAIYIWFAGDGNTETLTKLWYTWELDRVLKDGMHTRVLLFSGDGAKWYICNYANGSTTSKFKLYSETCYINRVEGLIW
jgi:hypothetical protein